MSELGFKELRNRAKTRNIAMLQTPTGFAFATAPDGNGSARVAVLRTESSRVEALVDTIRGHIDIPCETESCVTPYRN
jgi:hypothetical protein